MDLTIVDELKELLEQNTAVHALWIDGSVAEGYADELSDVDLWCDIDDGQDEAIFSSIEKFLQSKGVLDVDFRHDGSPLFTHKVYHLAHMDPYYFIEITLHSHSHNYEFIEGIRTVKVLFDKDNVVQFKPFDEANYNNMLQERRKFLLEKITLGELSVKKEITRQQFLDALHNYHFWLVEPVVELARITYAPLKISYGLKHATRDLPQEVVEEIESLYLISSLDDLHNKIKTIKKMAKKYT